MAYRGVILAGGRGTRLGERTRRVNKHLLPVGGCPMIFWAIRKLVGAGVSELAIVTGPEHVEDFVVQLGDGAAFGCTLAFHEQAEPGGIAQALALTEDFVGPARAVVLLGDNIFQDPLGRLLANASAAPNHAHVALKSVPDPARYAVATLDPHRPGVVLAIEEKPAWPASDCAVTGIYIYPPDVFDIIRTLQPSARGELEITGVNQAYLTQGRLCCTYLEGYWTDAGTPDSLEQANRLIKQASPELG